MGEAEISFHSLTVAVDRGAWTESHPGQFTFLKVAQFPLNTKLGVPRGQAGYYREEKNI
jgi:hypothetical protein